MKTYTVTIRFIGLTGTYDSKVDVEARDAKSATRKAAKTIGDRSGEIITVCEALAPEPGSVDEKRSENAARAARDLRDLARDYKAPEGGW